MNDTTSGLRQQILALGASIVGFADMDGVLQGELARWPRAISIAVCPQGQPRARTSGHFRRRKTADG
jgi:hypothetical protein